MPYIEDLDCDPYECCDTEAFERAMETVIGRQTPASLLAIPGVMELVREELKNKALRYWEVSTPAEDQIPERFLPPVSTTKAWVIDDAGYMEITIETTPERAERLVSEGSLSGPSEKIRKLAFMDEWEDDAGEPIVGPFYTPVTPAAPPVPTAQSSKQVVPARSYVTKSKQLVGTEVADWFVVTVMRSGARFIAEKRPWSSPDDTELTPAARDQIRWDRFIEELEEMEEQWLQKSGDEEQEAQEK